MTTKVDLANGVEGILPIALGGTGSSTAQPVVTDSLTVGGNTVFKVDATGYDSPFSLSASVASNAITVTLKSGGWRFRSTTLTDGTPVYVRTLSDLTLNIAATDSFGAATAGGNQRIAILVANNAGTLQLAATNVSGGLLIDESNLITTATAATTATVIKSGSVTTSVSYRVIGYINAPFTTGTGHGALVSVQSCVGQALDGMNGLGYGQKWQDLTGSRVLGTTYYNTTGKPIYISESPATTTSHLRNFNVNGVSIGSSAYNSVSSGYIPYTFIVPIGCSYSISGSGSIGIWAELR